jgi:hypothetical protein
MITLALCVLSGRRGLSFFGWMQWVLRVLAALPLLVSGVAHFTRTAYHHPAVFPPPCAAGLAQWSARTRWSSWPFAACLHPRSLFLSCAVDDRDLSRQCVCRQSVGWWFAHAQRAGSISDAGRLHRATAHGRLGNPAHPKSIIGNRTVAPRTLSLPNDTGRRTIGLVPRLRRSVIFGIGFQPFRAGLTFGGRPSGPAFMALFAVSFLPRLAAGKLRCSV